VCEATGHKAMECPDKRAASEGSAASRKRERESATPSGFTPEAKKAQSGPKEGSSKPPPVKAPKVTYAVVSGGNDLVVRNNDGSAPTAAQEKQLSVQFNEELCKLLEKGEDWCPAFNSWSRRAHGIAVNVPDERTVRWLKAKFSNLGYSVCTRKEYNDSRRTRLTGFLRGAISENLSDKAINLITSSMLKMRKVPDGSFTVGKLEKTEAGGILPLYVDDAAMEVMAGFNYTIPIGTAGLVVFQDVRRKGSARKLEAQEAVLSQRLEDLRKTAKETENALLAVRNVKEAAAAEVGVSLAAGLALSDGSEAPEDEGARAKAEGSRGRPMDSREQPAADPPSSGAADA